MVRNRFRLTALIAAAMVWAAGGGQSKATAQDAYTLDPNWPRYPGDMVFEMGTGVAVGADGVIYTISRDIDHWAAHPLAMSRYKGKGTVARWDSAGRFLGTFADEQEFIGPHSMYVDAEGFVWVVDREGHQVVKLTPDGDAVMKLGEYGVFGDDEGHFNGPTGVAFLPDGRVVVSDGYWNSRLVWFDEDGNYLKEVGGLGGGPGQLALPHAIALDPAGRLIVGNVCGTALHPYVTAPGQIAPERLEPISGCVSRFEVFTREGEYVGPLGRGAGAGAPVEHRGLWRPDLRRCDRVAAGPAGFGSDRCRDRRRGLPDSKRQRLRPPDGDGAQRRHLRGVGLPEHGGEPRGIEGPSFVRWALDR